MKNNLNNIAKLKIYNRKRIGRGIGSGSGKTCGRGVKGQKARTGCSIKGFEGGQTPIYMRLPKKGFKRSSFPKKYELINMKNIFSLIEKNKIKASDPITKEFLFKYKMITSINSKIKLIMFKKDSTMDHSINIKADYYSKKARYFLSKTN